jgi:hypothetical protein
LAETSGTLLGLDRQGWIQAVGGAVIGLIALFSSYDHISLVSVRVGLNQQWGIWLIAASMALVVVDAQLASGSRSRAADESAQERDRAAEDREQAARRDRAQAQRDLEQFRRSLVLVQLQQAHASYAFDPSAAQREQLAKLLSDLASPAVQALFNQELPEP